MERSIDGFRGRILKLAGDELLAVFNTAEDAFHAACDMQQRISDLPPVSGIKLSIRIGFHLGVVVESKDGCTGEAAGIAARLAGLSRAEQILTSAATVSRLPELLQLSVRDLQQTANKGKAEGIHLFEVLWHGSEMLRSSETVPVPASSGAPRLAAAAEPSLPQGLLRHAGKSFAIDLQHPVLTLGRDSAADVVIRDQRASRQHARIERRGSDYVLSDHSTNGTYVSFSGQPEILLRRGELVLCGNACLSFAAPAASEGADVAEFVFS
jgi:hypothetical protein